MTTAAQGRPATARDAEAAAALLHDHGMRVSGARRSLLRALFAADGPQSAERLATASGAPDLASVYRNLELFERLGIVRHVHLGHGPGLYATGRWAGREFLVCERCGHVRSLDPAELDDVRHGIAERFGFTVAFTHFALTGLCADCAAATEAR